MSQPFWYHAWRPCETLALLVPFVHIYDSRLKLEDVWHHGHWRWDILCTMNSEEVKLDLMFFDPIKQAGDKTSWFWINSNTLTYLTKSSMIRNDSDLLDKIKEILRNNWTTTLVLIQRTANKTTDLMTKTAALNKQWRRELFQWELELVGQLHETLQSAKPTHEKEDTVSWKFDNTGVYSTNSFTQMMQAEVLPAEVTSYSFTRAIWKGFVPPRIELLSWFVLIGRVNTKDRLCRLRVIDQHDTLCVLCSKSEETVFHLFLGCDITWQVWCAWLHAFGRSWCPPGNLKDHFESWITMAIWKVERKRWFLGFFAVVWTIWLERNSRLFRNHRSSLREIINKSFASAEEWIGGEPFGC
nr:uncharacterized protein LOC112803815 [Arachis hypogaea]